MTKQKALQYETFALSISCLALFAIGTAVADDLTIPNTFTSGTPARAADVNANFAAVEASVDDNAADIAANTGGVASNSASVAANTSAIATNQTAITANATAISLLTVGSGVMVYSQGVPIGRLLSAGGNSDSPLFVLSDKGFVFQTNTDNLSPNGYLGREERIYFSGADCTGDAFVTTGEYVWERAIGSVFRSEVFGPSFAYYTPRGSSVMPNTPFLSFNNGNTCNNANPGVEYLYPAFPNDEAITGVPNTAPTFPLTIGLP